MTPHRIVSFTTSNAAPSNALGRFMKARQVCAMGTPPTQRGR